jgi:hypothetical protein
MHAAIQELQTKRLYYRTTTPRMGSDPNVVWGVLLNYLSC